MRYRPRNGVRGGAECARIFGNQYDGEIMKFGEVAMGRTPHDTTKRSKKPDCVCGTKVVGLGAPNRLTSMCCWWRSA